jgi:phosphonate transport system ATP-binding protein
VLRNVLSGRVGYHPTWKMVLGLFSKEDKIKAMDALEPSWMITDTTT